jgi:type I restriction enzyme R subunit
LTCADVLGVDEQTKADVEVFILDEVFAKLPTPPFTTDEKVATPTSGSRP